MYVRDTQIEGLDYDETFAPVARMEAIRMFLDFACYHDFKVYQMDVKSAFLNGDLEEDVYMEQPEGFSLADKHKYVCRLKKALFGLKQAPHAWYSRLDKYFQKQGFKKGGVENNLYIEGDENELLIVVVYVDDIMFGSNKDELVIGFAEDMSHNLRCL